MKYPTIVVNGVSVRFDDEGRYNLNDLHAAAVTNGQATESQRPGEFLKSKQVKAFVSELNDAKMIASVKSIKGGKEQRTKNKGHGDMNSLPSAMRLGLTRVLKFESMRRSGKLY